MTVRLGPQACKARCCTTAETGTQNGTHLRAFSCLSVPRYSSFSEGEDLAAGAGDGLIMPGHRSLRLVRVINSLYRCPLMPARIHEVTFERIDDAAAFVAAVSREAASPSIEQAAGLSVEVQLLSPGARVYLSDEVLMTAEAVFAAVPRVSFDRDSLQPRCAFPSISVRHSASRLSCRGCPRIIMVCQTTWSPDALFRPPPRIAFHEAHRISRRRATNRTS